MDDLVTWLRAALDEDERWARDATSGPWEWGIPDPLFWRQGAASEDLLHGPERVQVLMTSKAGAISVANANHIARWDPARVLAEVEAKRLRLAVLANIANDPPPFAGMAWNFLKIEAHPYRDRPGFRDEWRLA